MGRIRMIANPVLFLWIFCSTATGSKFPLRRWHRNFFEQHRDEAVSNSNYPLRSSDERHNVLRPVSRLGARFDQNCFDRCCNRGWDFGHFDSVFREQNFRNDKIGALLQGKDSKVGLLTLVGEK